MSLLDAPPIRCFLSYAHEDDLVMDFVEPFTKSLRQYAYADRGRELEIFVDREAIGWGDLAQPAVRAAVRGATVFLPLLTRRYFDRPDCREELFVFYNQTLVEDVRSLLLPVVLLGESHLTDDTSDLAVQLVAERQQRRIREAWVEGPSSAAWRRTLLGLANDLVDRVEEAERRLAEYTPPPVPDAAEAVAVVERFGHETQRLTEVIGAVLHEFQLVMTAEVPDRLKAETLWPHAVALRDAARTYEGRVLNVDRAVRAHSYPVGPDAAELVSLADGIEALLASTRRVELLSVPMRRTMTAFRDGLTALRGAVNMVKLWADLPNTGQ